MISLTRLSMGAVVAATFALGIAPVGASAASNPIVIEQCFVTVPKAMSKLASGTQIVYVNKSSKTASQSAVSLLLVTIVEARAFRSTRSW